MTSKHKVPRMGCFRGNAVDFHPVGVQFKSWPEDQLSWESSWFLQSLRANSGMTQLDNDCFLQNSNSFISCLLMLYSVDTKSIIKQPMGIWCYIVSIPKASLNNHLEEKSNFYLKCATRKTSPQFCSIVTVLCAVS